MITSLIATSSGAGASTITYYVARCLSLLKHSVLVIDINNCCDLSKKLGVSYNGDKLKNNLPHGDLHSMIRTSKYKNIDTISIGPGHFSSNCEWQKQIQQSKIFHHIENELSKSYTHIIIDCGFTYPELNNSAVKISDKVIGIVEAQPQNINALTSFFKNCAQARINKPLHEISLLLNKLETHDMGCRYTISKIKGLLNQEVLLSVFVSRMKYVLKERKILHKVPMNSFQKLANYINKPTEFNSPNIASKNTKTNQLASLYGQIINGNAKLKQEHVHDMDFSQESQFIIDLDSFEISSVKLDDNIQEFFNFIQKLDLCSSATIVDSQGLVIANYGDNNKVRDLLAAGFSQYHQFLEFADMVKNDNQVLLKIDNNYLHITAIETQQNSYGLLMISDKEIDSKQRLQINRLLKSIIKKV